MEIQLHLVLFTFHNVSINTEKACLRPVRYINLHSTMFLLIHGKGIEKLDDVLIYIPQCFY